MFAGEVRSESLRLTFNHTYACNVTPECVCDAFMQTVFLYFISAGIVWDVHGTHSISTLPRSRFIAPLVTDRLEY